MLWKVCEELQGLPRDPASFWSCSWGSKVVVGVAVAAVAHVVVRHVIGGRSRRYEDPADTVILVVGARGPYAPSLVPFSVKLETFCRMADIPYKTELVWNPSSKGKMPWLRYNGQEVADSSFCLQFLSDTFHKDLNSKLSPEQRAVGRALTKMLEENTYWTMGIERWLYDNNFWRVVAKSSWEVPLMLFYLVWGRPKLRRAAWCHGIGRHSKQELFAIMEADLQAVSCFLGNKDFIFGAEPCEVDCAVFGQLSQFLWHLPNMHGEMLVREKFPNLRAYCLRMKERFWQDWDSVVPRVREV